MPPTSLRPAVSAANSAPISKSAVCTLILAMASAAGHGGEERHLVTGRDAGRGVGEVLVHRATHRAAVGEGAGVAGAAFRQECHEVSDRPHAGGPDNALLCGAGAFAQPGEVEDGQ